MVMRVFSWFRSVVFVVGLVFAGGIFVVQTDAQTPKRTPKPLATPTPTLSDAEIISRAMDQQDDPPEVVTPSKKNGAANSTDPNAAKVKELSARVKKLETQKSDADDKQKRLLMNLDILSRSEQRADALRKDLFDMIDKENSVKARLAQIEYDIRPEMIERTLQMAGSLRPEEVREMKRKSLDAERTSLQSLLGDIQATRASLTVNVQKADDLVEKLRTRIEKEIDDSLKDDPQN